MDHPVKGWGTWGVPTGPLDPPPAAAVCLSQSVSVCSCSSVYLSICVRRLSQAQIELEAVMNNLKEKQAMLASVEEKIAALQKSFEDSVNEKERLEANMALTQARLKRAGKLTAALADEKTRWEESVAVSSKAQY